MTNAGSFIYTFENGASTMYTLPNAIISELDDKLYIEHTVTRMKTTVAKNRCKTDASYRSYPIPEQIQQLLKIRPRGNGGTDFGCIFRYVNRFFEKPPACIVIFTDGRGDYPAEEEALGVPVLWILYGGVPFPRWGTHARILT